MIGESQMQVLDVLRHRHLHIIMGHHKQILLRHIIRCQFQKDVKSIVGKNHVNGANARKTIHHIVVKPSQNEVVVGDSLIHVDYLEGVLQHHRHHHHHHHRSKHLLLDPPLGIETKIRTKAMRRQPG